MTIYGFINLNRIRRVSSLNLRFPGRDLCCLPLVGFLYFIGGRKSCKRGFSVNALQHAAAKKVLIQLVKDPP